MALAKNMTWNILCFNDQFQYLKGAGQEEISKALEISRAMRQRSKTTKVLGATV